MNAKDCPACGRAFASIRCPSCGFSGEDDFFTDGCPVCGYTARKAPRREGAAPVQPLAGALPLWVYVLTGLAVLGLSVILFFRR